MLSKEQSALWDALGLGPQWVSREELEQLQKAAQKAPTPAASPAEKAAEPKPDVSDTPQAPVERVRAPSAPAENRPLYGSRAVSLVDAENKDRLRKIKIATWEELNNIVSQCTVCDIGKNRTNAVFGTGEPTKDLVLIGEAPGETEDRLGKVFVGASGNLLDVILSSLKLQRGIDLAIVNTLKCRPPHNANPSDEEMSACRPVLERQIELLDPKLIVVMGRPAAKWIFGSDASLTSRRGTVYEVSLGGKTRKVIVTYHPSYLLRTPSDKRKAWVDWCLVLQTMRDLKHEDGNV